MLLLLFNHGTAAPPVEQELLDDWKVFAVSRLLHVEAAPRERAAFALQRGLAIAANIRFNVVDANPREKAVRASP